MTVQGAPRALGHHVRRARRRGFFGREDQVRLFERALAGDVDAPRVLHLHGPGGIGKSALLLRLADDAERAGREVVWVDGQHVDASPDAFAEAAAPAVAAERPVLVVDSFEQCQDLEAWLRDELLPRLPEDAVVVVAGRRRPEPRWTLDPGWRELVDVTLLEPLTEGESRALLTDRGVAPQDQDALAEFGRGHPLALCLVADAAEDTEEPWRPPREVVETLLGMLVDDVPGVEAEFALRVAAHVRHTTVDLLRTGLDDDRAVAAFEWLRGLPYVESDALGLRPQDLVRDVVDSDFAWRDPEGYADLHERLWRHLARRVDTASEESVRDHVPDLLFLNRYAAGLVAEVFTGSSEQLVDRPYEPHLHAAVVELVARHEGPDEARRASGWLEERPEDFTVQTRPDDDVPVALLGLLRLRDLADRAVRDDPALVAVAQHVGSDVPGEGEHVAVARFLVPRPDPERYTAGADLHARRISTATVAGGRELAASYLVLPRPAVFGPRLATFAYEHVRDLPRLGDGDWGLFVHDWRSAPLADLLRRTVPAVGTRTIEPAVVEQPPTLGREEHDEAVRQALRDWHDDAALEVNPLARDGVETLRSLVAAAVDDLASDPRDLKKHRAVAATFLERVTTQEAAATRLGVPFSTYRRHLRLGLEHVCAHAWHHAT